MIKPDSWSVTFCDDKTWQVVQRYFMLIKPGREPLWEFLPSAKSFFTIDRLCKRKIQTLNESSEQADKDEESHKASSLRLDSVSSKPLSNPTDNDQWDSNSPKALSNQINNDNPAVKFNHLGMFGLPGSIEDILAARGEEVRRGPVDTLNITLEDLAGKEFAKKDG
ncbi:hypothetical protein RHSIM_Rhsim05G0120600 [Rhododendron simsii]|uniref:Uncharacterized protein n=1 Tax=Rhododendron simsii TaxID=118357 RepID=A0A834H041_RHOSS|nr:hypothetical protein RHSIM_Rhsim05G0120600 [Rhododendron simsii]